MSTRDDVALVLCRLGPPHIAHPRRNVAMIRVAHQPVLLGVTVGRPVRQFILITFEINSRGFSK